MANPTILVTGSNGQLGNSFKQISHQSQEYIWIFTDIEELDIANEDMVSAFFKNNSIDYVINCAAYTAVDKAENDIELATKINTLAPELLAKNCNTYKSKFIHVSTDYVFDGSKNTPYSETDPVSPLGIYGKTKYNGEQAVLKALPSSIIVRTSWLYSEYGNNFVKTMIRLGSEKPALNVIFDQTGTPTYAKDLADSILRIINQDYISNVWHNGVFHFSNEGVCSWFDFATEIIKYLKFDCAVSPIETFEYPTPAKRPHYSVLNKKRIKNLYGIEIPHWKESLHTCISNLLGT